MISACVTFSADSKYKDKGGFFSDKVFAAQLLMTMTVKIDYLLVQNHLRLVQNHLKLMLNCLRMPKQIPMFD